MRKFLLFALFVVLAHVANTYFTTGQLPLVEKRTLNEEEKNLKQLKHDFLELREKYFEPDEDSFYDEELTPEVTLRELDKINRKFELLRPSITGEFAKAEVGWLKMEIRKFKKKIEMDEAI